MRYEVRPFRSEDLGFIVDAWLNAWRKNRYAGVVPNHLYYPTQRTLIEDLIARGARIVVADSGKRLADGRPFILGFACAELKEDRTVLHFVNVKDPFLRRGIEEKLVEALPGGKPGFITHHLSQYVNSGWEWVPEIARRKTL